MGPLPTPSAKAYSRLLTAQLWVLHPVPAGDSLKKSTAQFRTLCSSKSASCMSTFTLNTIAAQTGRLLEGFSDGEIVASGALLQSSGDLLLVSLSNLLWLPIVQVKYTVFSLEKKPVCNLISTCFFQPSFLPLLHCAHPGLRSE